MKFDEIAEGLGLEYDEESKIIFGKKDDYNLCINIRYDHYYRIFLNGYYITFSIKKDDKIPTTFDVNKVVNSSKEIKKAEIRTYGVSFIIPHGMSPEKKDINLLSATIDSITSTLKEIGYVDCCHLCGSESDISTYMLNGKPTIECSTCYNKNSQTEQYLKKPRLFKRKNIITAILGAFLGALIGVFAMIVIMQVNLASALSGTILAVATMKGYELLANKIDLKGIIISVVIALIMIYIGYKITITIALAYYTKIDVFTLYVNIPFYLSMDLIDNNLFYTSLFKIYFFSLLGFIPAIKYLIVTQNVRKDDRQLNSVLNA